MINQIPGRLGRRLTTPFELVYGEKPDSSTWFELFSIGYFDHKVENSASKSNTEVQTLAGIAVGRDEKANTIRFYNPLTRAYYSPPVFKLEEGRLPASLFPTKITFDGGLVCGLQSNNTDPSTEPFPPGTRVNVLINGETERGTIQQVPMPLPPILEPNAQIQPQGGEESNVNTNYTVLLDNNTTVQLTFADLLSPSSDTPPVDPAAPSTVWQGIPSRYLHQDAKITYEHDGTYHKGYLSYSEQTGFEFLVRRNTRSKKIDFRVPLPDFSRNWTTLLAEERLLFGHTTVSSFLRRDSYNNAPSANHVSAKNLINPCPPSLNKALHPSNPDRHVWLESYKEEKGGLEQLEVFERINKKQYLHLKRTGRIDPQQEALFMEALKTKVVVDFMGPVDWFLGTAFTWKRHEDGNLSVLLSQSAFIDFTAHRFAVDRFKPVPHMTPYRSGIPIDSIPPPPKDDPDQKRRTKVYQSIVGCINWVATCTRPDIAPALTFLASYNNCPSHGHYQAALHALKYLYSTSEYGISYHSDASNTIQAFNHFPSHRDKEAYEDATPPSPGDVQRLTSFSDACWGGQFGNAVPDGTPLELFKFR
eukprot:scaffold22287_cov36-Cyclotella_meneghiniana.AAC.2